MLIRVSSLVYWAKKDGYYLLRKANLMRKIKTFSLISLTGIGLSYLNYYQIIRQLNYYRGDYRVDLPKRAIFNRLFIHTDFYGIDYMGGKNVMQLVSPFIFFLTAVVVGSFFFLSMEKNYYQYVLIRSENKKKGYRWIRRYGSVKVVVFSLVFHLSLFTLVSYGNNYPYAESLRMFNQSFVKLSLAHTLLLLGLWYLGFCLYLKVTSLGYLFGMSGVITSLFIINMSFPKASLIFIDWQDNYSISSVLGMCLIVLSYFWEKKLDYEI